MMDNPGLILQWLNQELLDQHMDKHVALLIAICDLGEDRLCFANAGHYPPLAFVSGGKARFAELRGKPIGLFDSVEYETATLNLAAGDRVVMLTDGALEVLPGGGLQHKERRLLEAVARNDSMDGLWRALELAEGEDAHGPDDITCLMVTREA